jgi:hypothetical protein
VKTEFERDLEGDLDLHLERDAQRSTLDARRSVRQASSGKEERMKA